MKRTIALILASTYFLTAPIQARAAESGVVAQDIHDQLTYSNQATVYIDNETDLAEVIARATAIDNESTPYDGEMLIYRAPHFAYKRYNTGKLELTLSNAYSIDDAEKLLDIMELEIRNSRSSENQKDTLNAIIKYINDTYEYDNETFNSRKSDKEVRYTNFVEEYYGNRKIACGQYAALTYLLCNRFGIDCKVVHGNNHLHNIIRLDGQTTYYAYDLTKAEYHLPVKVDFIDLLTFSYINIGNSKMDKIENAVAKATLNGENYHFSITAESITVIVILITTVAIIIRKNSYRKPKKHISKSKVATKRYSMATR